MNIGSPLLDDIRLVEGLDVEGPNHLVLPLTLFVPLFLSLSLAALFFWFLKKWQDGDYLKFGEAFYFFIHSSLGPENTFQINSYSFSPKFVSCILIFSRNEKILVKKDYFFLAKSRHLF